MEKTCVLNKTSWVINPWIDILIFAGLPIVLIVIYLLNHIRLHYPAAFSTLNSYWFARFILPHFFLTFGIVYLDRHERKGKNTVYLWIPLILIIVTIALSVKQHFNLVTTILFYGIVWHILAQNQYILQLHKLKNQDNLILDKIIDNFTLMLGPTYFLFASLPNLKVNYIGGAVYCISVNSHILNYLSILTCFTIALFILRQVYIFIKWKRIHIFKIMMIFITIVSFYYTLIMIKSAHIFMMGVFRWHHNIQYIVWAWFYHRKKFAEGIREGAKVISYLSQPGRTGLYFLFFMFLSLIYSLVSTVISSLTINRGFIISVIYAAFVSLHIFLDSFILKISKTGNIVNN